MMTCEQMFAAIKALDDDACLRMRAPGDWYVDADMGIGGDGMLRVEYGNGTTPEDAIRQHFAIFAAVAEPKYIVVRNGEERRHYCWAGFMWREVPRRNASHAQAGGAA